VVSGVQRVLSLSLKGGTLNETMLLL